MGYRIAGDPPALSAQRENHQHPLLGLSFSRLVSNQHSEIGNSFDFVPVGGRLTTSP
jgi:hypothetical protein